MSYIQENRVILPSLNYADISPEVIENEVKLVRFTPTQTINGASQNDIIKFIMQSNGFFDPYSAVLRFTVEVPQSLYSEDTEIKFLDRSAHSFINALLIRSQGVELERIEHYDTIAAMVNDMLYSQEQCQLHGFEGFGTQELQYGPRDTFSILNEQVKVAGDDEITKGSISVKLPDDVSNYNVMYTGADYTTQLAVDRLGKYYSIGQRRTIAQLLSGASTNATKFDKIGEPAFFQNQQYDSSRTHTLNTAPVLHNQAYGDNFSFFPFDMTSNAVSVAGLNKPDLFFFDHVTNGNPASKYSATSTFNNITSAIRYRSALSGVTRQQFCIPLYSGLLGVFQPQKKLIPLSLLPIDLELRLNPHALYSSHENGNRRYTIQRIEIFAHVLFFESSVHQALESLVARQGLHLHVSSFYNAPQTIIGTSTVPGYAQVNMAFKSINSLHWVFMYSNYQNSPCARKNHFVSHNIRRLQVRNGMYLIPNEQLESLQTGNNIGTNGDGSHIPFLIETLKSWGRLHDPGLDAGIYAFNYCSDNHIVQISPLTLTLEHVFGYYPLHLHTDEESDQVTGLDQRALSAMEIFLGQIIQKQANVGRCQYGISLEGEELGQEKNFLTGRRGMLPFDINFTSDGKYSSDPSQLMIFIRHDSIVHIKPDLTPELLGR